MLKHFCLLILLLSIILINVTSDEIKSQNADMETSPEETKRLRLTSPLIAAFLRFPEVVRAIFSRSGRSKIPSS